MSDIWGLEKSLKSQTLIIYEWILVCQTAANKYYKDIANDKEGVQFIFKNEGKKESYWIKETYEYKFALTTLWYYTISDMKKGKIFAHAVIQI